MSDWFKQIFGFNENNVKQELKEILIDEDGYKTLVFKPNDLHKEYKLYPVGKFTTPQLSHLREAGEAILKQSEKKIGIQHKFIINHKINNTEEDIFKLFTPGCNFQVNSYINNLYNENFNNPIYDNITNYKSEYVKIYTAGIVYRKYFVPIVDISGNLQYGQTIDLYLNNLDELELFIENETNQFLIFSPGRIFQIHFSFNEYLTNLDLDQKNKLKGSIKIGIHENKDKTVLNICSINGFNTFNKLFLQILLEANYEATIWASLIYAFKKKIDHCVYLTIDKYYNVNNKEYDSIKWIKLNLDAICNVLNFFYKKLINLNVTICYNFLINETYLQSIQTEYTFLFDKRVVIFDKRVVIFKSKESKKTKSKKSVSFHPNITEYIVERYINDVDD